MFYFCDQYCSSFFNPSRTLTFDGDCGLRDTDFFPCIQCWISVFLYAFEIPHSSTADLNLLGRVSAVSSRNAVLSICVCESCVSVFRPEFMCPRNAGYDGSVPKPISKVRLGKALNLRRRRRRPKLTAGRFRRSENRAMVVEIRNQQ